MTTETIIPEIWRDRPTPDHSADGNTSGIIKLVDDFKNIERIREIISTYPEIPAPKVQEVPPKKPAPKVQDKKPKTVKMSEAMTLIESKTIKSSDVRNVKR